MINNIFDPMFFAVTEAYDFITKPEYYLSGPNDLVIKRFDKALPYLLKYQDESPYCREAISFIQTCKEHFGAIEQARMDAPAKRKDISSNYRQLLAYIGKRDGFYCRACNSVSDLQIDHVKPVAKGGTNDLDNLQLLCGACNRQKSDKWNDQA